MNKNFWGEPDDVEPLPDWMNPNTYRDPLNNRRKMSESLEKTAEKCLKKPPIPTNGWEYKE